MTFTDSNSFESSSQICLISLKQLFKKPNPTDDFISLGYFPINLKIFILNIIVLLCTLNLFTSLMNFPLSLNLLKTFPWWYVMDIIHFVLVRIISLYCFITSAASLIFSTSPAILFSSCVSTVLLLNIESTNCFLISSLLSLLVFLVFSELFRSCKQKMTTIPQI